MAMAMAIAPVVPNQKVVDKLKKGVKVAAVAEEAAPENVAAPVVVADEPLGNEIDDFIETLSDTFETCKTVYEKNTKEQDEWYYYCGKVIEQISQTEEFHTTREQLYSLVISNLLEHMFFEDSLKLVNYLYQKNNYTGSGAATTGAATTGVGAATTGAATTGVGAATTGAATTGVEAATTGVGAATTGVEAATTGVGAATTGVIQPLSPFERMLLNYYEQHIIVRPLVGRRAATAATAASASEGARRTPQDLGLLLFHEKKEEQYALVVLRYETREWTAAEPEDERDYELLLGKLQTSHIQNMNMIVGFVSFFKKEYLIFKVKNMSKKRDKGARCDQSGKTETITIINNILMMNPDTQGDDYKLTIENTKQRTQKELCVFQEFLLRAFNANRVNGRKWFFAPGEALLCNIERL
jgi:hypothetical protein